MNRHASPLIRPMFEGPIDLVGDVHGEIDALDTLLQHLGYGPDGRHDDNRRLVFLGDLVDRGPDTPAVLRRVKHMVDSGRAQCVMGNHELNVLRGKVKSYNYWFHQEGDPADPAHADQRPLPRAHRDEMTGFLRGLPLGLERDDLRAVHACWNDTATGTLRQGGDPVDLFHAHGAKVRQQLDHNGVTDPVERTLAHQNGCPIKLTTSGPEERAQKPFESGERLRHEARVPWWKSYDHDAFCVFGHYSRTQPGSQDSGNLPLFPPDACAAVGHTMCIDFGVGGRPARRRDGRTDPRLTLAALRWPERLIVQDNGQTTPLRDGAGEARRVLGRVTA